MGIATFETCPVQEGKSYEIHELKAKYGARVRRIRVTYIDDRRTCWYMGFDILGAPDKSDGCNIHKRNYAEKFKYKYGIQSIREIGEPR